MRNVVSVKFIWIHINSVWQINANYCPAIKDQRHHDDSCLLRSSFLQLTARRPFLSWRHHLPLPGKNAQNIMEPSNTTPQRSPDMLTQTLMLFVTASHCKYLQIIALQQAEGPKKSQNITKHHQTDYGSPYPGMDKPLQGQLPLWSLPKPGERRQKKQINTISAPSASIKWRIMMHWEWPNSKNITPPHPLLTWTCQCWASPSQ